MKTMRKVVFLAVFTLLSQLVWAQKGLHLSVGASAGPSFVLKQYTYGSTELDTERRIGYTQDLGIGYNLTEQFGIYSGFSFAQLGGNWKGEEDGSTIARKLDIQLQQIPIMLRFSAKGRTKFYVMAGVQYNTIKSVTQTYTPASTRGQLPPGSPVYNSLVNSGDIGNRFVKTTWSGIFQMGADIVLHEKLYLTTGLRFMAGFNNLHAPAYRDPQQLAEQGKIGARNPNIEHKGNSKLYAGSIVLGITYVLSHD